MLPFDLLLGYSYCSSAALPLSGLSAGYHGDAVRCIILRAKSAFCHIQASENWAASVEVECKSNCLKIWSYTWWDGRQSTEKDHSFFVIEVWNKYLISHRAKQKKLWAGKENWQCDRLFSWYTDIKGSCLWLADSLEKHSFWEFPLPRESHRQTSRHALLFTRPRSKYLLSSRPPHGKWNKAVVTDAMILGLESLKTFSNKSITTIKFSFQTLQIHKSKIMKMISVYNCPKRKCILINVTKEITTGSGEVAQCLFKCLSCSMRTKVGVPKAHINAKQIWWLVCNSTLGKQKRESPQGTD